MMVVSVCLRLTCLGKWCCACSYGSTADGKLVDSAGLQLLENMGFERAVAAEALKQVLHYRHNDRCNTVLLHLIKALIAWSLQTGTTLHASLDKATFHPAVAAGAL